MNPPPHTKPCPFCGGDKLRLLQSRLDDIGFCGTAKVWYVHCTPCAIRGPIKDTPTAATSAWDTRP